MRQLPNAETAMAFSDPAGANACLALAEISRVQGKQIPSLFSNRQYDLSFAEKLTVIVSDEVPDFKQRGTRLLFTGTSHPQSSRRFECRCISQARRNSIYVISFVDHWVNFKLRFEGLHANEFPDEVWVVDQAAKTIAIQEGLPAERLVISGNPYHFYLKAYWKSSFPDKSYLSHMKVLPGKSHILFAPDPVSLRYTKEQVGFNEFEVLENILFVLAESADAPVLVIKLHPLQPLEGIHQVLLRATYKEVILLQEANVPELIHACDAVIGFYSNILLEAIALGKPVIRFFPGNRQYDLLRHTGINAIFTSDVAALKKAINDVL